MRYCIVHCDETNPSNRSYLGVIDKLFELTHYRQNRNNQWQPLNARHRICFSINVDKISLCHDDESRGWKANFITKEEYFAEVL